MTGSGTKLQVKVDIVKNAAMSISTATIEVGPFPLESLALRAAKLYKCAHALVNELGHNDASKPHSV